MVYFHQIFNNKSGHWNNDAEMLYNEKKKRKAKKKKTLHPLMMMERLCTVADSRKKAKADAHTVQTNRR